METNAEEPLRSSPKEYSFQERAEWVSRYRASGIGLKRFAAANGLKLLQLHHWVYGKRSSAAKRLKTHLPAFREIRVAECLGAVPWSAEIGLRDGTVVRFRVDADPAWAAALLGALHP